MQSLQEKILKKWSRKKKTSEKGMKVKLTLKIMNKHLIKMITGLIFLG